MAGHSISKFQHPRGSAALRRLRLAALTVLCAGTLAARAEVRFDVFLGYDGVVPQACWFPVVCEIKNDGPPFLGMVEVDGGRFAQEQTRRALVELPTGTLKRFVLPVFSTTSSFGTWDARLLDERGRVRAEQPGLRAKKQPASGVPLAGAMVRTPSGTPSFRPILLQDGDLQPVAARLLPSIFPDNPVVLAGLSCIYLSSEKAIDLTVTQYRALLDWLSAGGHLIVGVEQISEINATPWLRSVLPCALNDMRAVQGHSELQQWLQSASWPGGLAAQSEAGTQAFGRVATGSRPVPGSRPPVVSPQPGGSATDPFKNLPEDSAFEQASVQVATGEVQDGEVVAAAGDRPMIVTAHRGRGQVTVLLFSPEREPFRSWKNLPVLWARLAEVPGAWYVAGGFRQRGGWSTDGIFGAMIDSRQIHKLPVTWLLLLLVVYLVVIGPLDQRWLKRIGRPMLTWVTFPCYVVLFSLLIYFIGYKLRAGESEWNELHVVDVLPKGEQAELRGQTYASIYSPSNQRYTLEGRQEFATLRSEFMGTWSGAQQGEKASFMQAGDGSFKAEVFVPVWTSQMLVSDWWQAAPVPVKIALVPQGAQWQVTVENRTECALTSAHILIGQSVMRLGEVPARGTKTFKVSTGSGTPLTSFVLQHSASFQMAVQARQRTFGGGDSGRLTDLPGCSMAASFLAQLGGSQDSMQRFISPPGLDLSAVAGHGNAVLLAWAEDYSPVKPMRQFTPRRVQKHTLWRVAVPVSKDPRLKTQD